ncbi:MAG: S8 family serine peptidase [Pseudomonadota bacterium]
MRTTLLASCLATVLAFTAGTSDAADLPDGQDDGSVTDAIGRDALRPVPREWIVADAAMVVDASELVVITPDAADADAIAEASAPLGYSVLRRDSLGGLGQVLLVLRIPQGRTGPAAIAEIEALNEGVTAGVNHAYPVPPPSAAMTRLRFADAMMQWPSDGCVAHGGIGLIDTAIDQAVAEGLAAEISSADFRRDPDRQTGTEHGTALATLLAGPGRLLEPRIANAVVVGDNPSPEDAAGVDDLLRALDWVMRQGVEVVNISLAGPYNKILDIGVQAAAANGLIIVAAVGNDGPLSIPRFPAAFEGVIAVTAVDANLDVYQQAVQGPHVDFAAPGVDVLLPFEDPQFVTGTSVAAPFVTALIAADPRILGPFDPGDVVTELRARAQDIGETGQDPVFGNGIPLAAGLC